MNRDFLRQIYWRTWRCLALAAVLTTVTGCIVLPVPVNYHTHGSRKNLRAEDTPWLMPGQITRQEIALRLGEPDEIEDDGAKLVYRWEKIYLQVWVVVSDGAYSAGGGRMDYGRDYTLELTFDRHGALKEHALQKSQLETKGSYSF